MHYRWTGEPRYLQEARAANAFVRRTVRVQAPNEVGRTVQCSFPVDGDYGQYEYLNWAVKFTVDSNLLEQDLLRAG
jgi:hypothetical protein